VFRPSFELAAAWTLTGGLSLSTMLVASQRPSANLALAEADVQRLLTSTNAREQAWGAWIAGTEDRVEMIPLLEDIIRRRPEPATPFEEAARDAALDALIQLPSEPPAALLVPALGSRPAQALILMSRLRSGGEAELLDFVSSESRDEWYAAANILIARRTRGVARVLLNRLVLTVRVAVRNPGEELGLGPPCDGRFHLGCGFDAVTSCSGPLEGFPPPVSYAVERVGTRGAVLMTASVPVFYRRSVGLMCSPERSETTNGACLIDPTEHIVALAGILSPSVAQHLGIKSALSLPVPGGENRCVTWHGQDAFDVAIDRFRKEAEEDHAELVALLRRAGVLTVKESAELQPRINIEARDRNGAPVHYTRRPNR
jgi:hypothetical protein